MTKPSEPTPVTIACGCKRTLEDDAVITEPQYGFFANLTLLFGVTAAPKRVDWKCLACGKVIASSDDGDTIRKFTH
ncbi:MAG: hypothetical protein IT385_14375 [Deltaproteobacteria bacterium]|nr:hypothetical protein [Deltaproteobacteria bacterium]